METKSSFREDMPRKPVDPYGWLKRSGRTFELLNEIHGLICNRSPHNVVHVGQRYYDLEKL